MNMTINKIIIINDETEKKLFTHTTFLEKMSIFNRQNIKKMKKKVSHYKKIHNFASSN